MRIAVVTGYLHKPKRTVEESKRSLSCRRRAFGTMKKEAKNFYPLVLAKVPELID
jgi:hypothetical protein